MEESVDLKEKSEGGLELVGAEQEEERDEFDQIVADLPTNHDNQVNGGLVVFEEKVDLVESHGKGVNQLEEDDDGDPAPSGRMLAPAGIQSLKFFGPLVDDHPVRQQTRGVRQEEQDIATFQAHRFLPNISTAMTFDSLIVLTATNTTGRMLLTCLPCNRNAIISNVLQ